MTMGFLIGGDMSEATLVLSTLFMMIGVASLCIAASLRPEPVTKEPQRPIIMVIEAPRRDMIHD